MEGSPVQVLVNITAAVMGREPNKDDVKIAVFGTPLTVDSANSLYEQLGSALNHADELRGVLSTRGPAG